MCNWLVTLLLGFLTLPSATSGETSKGKTAAERETEKLQELLRKVQSGTISHCLKHAYPQYHTCALEFIAKQPGHAKNAVNHSMLADRLSRGGFTKQAILHYEKAISLDPKFSAARVSLADLLDRFGPDEKALKLYKDAVRTSPGEYWIKRRLARAYRRRNMFREALKIYVARKQKKFSSTREFMSNEYNIAWMLVRTRRPREAIPTLRNYVSMYPTETTARHNLGFALMFVGNHKKAATQFEIVLKARPEHVFANYHLGLIRVREGNFKAAEQHLERAAGKAPKNGRVHFALGMTYNRLGKAEKAKIALTRACKLKYFPACGMQP